MLTEVQVESDGVKNSYFLKGSKLVSLQVDTDARRRVGSYSQRERCFG